MEDTVITDRLYELKFRVYSRNEILKLSVKELTNPQPFDNLQLPTLSGLYDPALGATRNDENCSSCGQSALYCPGHMGHINLALPVFSPVFFKTLLKILQGTCLSCHRLYIGAVEGALFLHQMALLEKGCVVGARNLEEYVLQYRAEKAEKVQLFQNELLANMENLASDLINDSSANLTLCTKMVSSEKLQLVDNALKCYFKTPKACPHCKKETLTVRHEYFSRITAKSGRERRSALEVATSKRPRRAAKPNSAENVPPETEADLETVIESKEGEEVDNLLVEGKGQCLIMPHLAQQVLRKVWQNDDGKVLRKVFSCLEEVVDCGYPTDIFFLNVLLVPPPRFRPLSRMGDRQFENPQSASLSRIMTVNCELHQILANMNLDLDKSIDLTVQEESNSAMVQVQSKWIQLQSHVNSLIDSDLDKLSLDSQKIQGVRQLLEKKEGLFRMHMMGKRVNYAARSVISPDPFINTNEIGVPSVFAEKLTYPQPVTPWNVHELRQYVINGPIKYPGASAVVNEDGNIIKLSPSSQTQREAIAKQLLTPSNSSSRTQQPKKVLRHLRDGDVLLLNRQPTLHRCSIQAHRARVLPGLKTLRLHYSNCKAYNADFDGDEMNAHFPQSELCRAEAYGIASTDFQYLVPKDGTPLAGLIQDHLLGGVALTVRGQFFPRDDYQNLLQSGLSGKRSRILLLPPAIMKPGQLWTGKQVISTLLLNIIPKDKPPLCMESKAKIKEKSWIRRYVDNPKPYLSLAVAQKMTEDLGESTVVIDHGELLQGVLDKAQCGPSSYGLIHCVYELYGGEIAGRMLTCLGRLFTAFLKLRGFTLGIEDILVDEEAEIKRRKKIIKAPKEGYRAALSVFGMTKEDCSDAELLHLLKKAHFSSDDFIMKQLDNSAKKITNEVSEKISLDIIGKHLYKSFPENNLQLMVQSGAKGGLVNCIQISSMLGQIELEGRRPPLMISGKSLPSFLPYDLSLKARGFVTGRFLTGIQPQEYFFHCMAGREGLIDTAVKTSRSGYLQRCLVKHLEGLTVNYDMTVRDSDSSVIQFLYGEDGIEVARTPFLEEAQFPFLLKNQDILNSQAEQSKTVKKVEKHKKKIDKWWKKHSAPQKRRTSGFLDFCSIRQPKQHQVDNHLNVNTGRSARVYVLETEWRGLNPKKKYKLLKRHRPCPEPVISKFWPQRYSGVISEKMQKSVDLIKQQLIEVGKNFSDPTKEQQSLVECKVLQQLVNRKVMKSLCPPGEAVGLLCAQSIGEPSTQMTLNTFHFAGRGEMNVTLGIPRLREVIMLAGQTILTPCMEIPVFDTPEAKAEAEKLQKRLSRVFLSDVLQDVKLQEYLQLSPTDGSRKRMYRIHFTILPRNSYSDKLDLKPKEIVQHIERVLLGHIAKATFRLMNKHAKEQPDLVSQSTLRSVERKEEEASAAAADDGDSDVEVHDDDATAAKALARHSDTQEYEGEEEEKQAVGETTQLDDLEDSEEAQGELERTQGGDDDDIEANDDLDIKAIKTLSCILDYRRHKKGCEVVMQFNVKRYQIDMKSVVEREVRKLVVQQVPGIKRCMLMEKENRYSRQRRLHLVTEGINLQNIFKYGYILDLNYLYTNNIYDIQTTYGIEAANKAIIKEVQSVFKPYEIEVNPRHLSLLADYMTCEGFYKGFNRTAITTNPSPLQKITFETSMNFLVGACAHAQPDQLRSPSARIMAGQVVLSGTGCFEIVQPLKV